MIRDAAWLLRRYRDQACPDWQVREVLGREFNRLIEARYSHVDIGEIRRSAPKRLADFDALTDQALQYLSEHRFDLALREIRNAAATLAELRSLSEAASELEAVTRETEAIEALLSPTLVALATPRGLRRLLALTRDFLDQGEPRKARFVTLLLRSELADLLARSECSAKRPSVLLSLAELQKGPGRETKAQLARLLEEGYLDLARILAEDLEVDLAVFSRQQRATATPGGALGPMTVSLRQTQLEAEALAGSLATWLASRPVNA
jgi:hypothetical protein